MCFSPQRRAIFQHLNFQKWSRIVSFLTFSLPNVLFATAACNFWCLLWAPTSAPAALTGLLFDWPDTRIIEKTQHFATSLTFGADVSSFFWLSRYCIFCRLTWRLYCWAMHLLFNSPYCRKFLFKLPSMTLKTPHPSNATLPPRNKAKNWGLFRKAWWVITPYFKGRLFPGGEKPLDFDGKKMPSQAAPQFSSKKIPDIEEVSQVEILDESIGIGVPSFWVEWWSGVNF